MQNCTWIAKNFMCLAVLYHMYKEGRKRDTGDRGNVTGTLKANLWTPFKMHCMICRKELVLVCRLQHSHNNRKM